MKFTSIFSNDTSENTYLIYDENTLSGAVVDPGCPVDAIEKMTEACGVKVKYILLTHCHYDHIMSLIPFKEKTGAKIVTGDKGNENIGNPKINLTKRGLGYEIRDVKSDIILNDGDTLTFDGVDIKCIYTPGHTDCGVCYLSNGNLFAGDTLFLRSCGRWDLPTGDMETLEKSIREKLYTLPNETAVHPGHGNSTTIGYEKQFNFCIKP